MYVAVASPYPPDRGATLGHGPPFHTRAHTMNRTGLGSGSSSDDVCPQPADMNAAPFKGFLKDLLHFENYFLSFGANSELLGEVTQVHGLGMIPEH